MSFATPPKAYRHAHGRPTELFEIRAAPGGSWHGGAAMAEEAAAHTPRCAHTPQLLRAKPPRPTASTPWTVHDGKFFATTFANTEPKPRAPQERKVLTAHHKNMLGRDERRRLKEMGVKASTIERLGMRSAELLKLGAGQSGVVVPQDLQNLGGRIVPISDFREEGDAMFSLLGVGDFSSVHKAERTTDGAAVALKIFHHPVKLPPAPGAEEAGDGSLHGVTSGPDPRFRPEQEFDRQDALSFVREVACLAQSALVHESIVSYLGHGFVKTDDGLAGFIAMELVPGADLYGLVLGPRRTRLSTEAVEKWALQLASGIAHLHAHGIVHRDVKETNAMITNHPAAARVGTLDAEFEAATTSANRPNNPPPPSPPSHGDGDLVIIDLGLAVPLPVSSSSSSSSSSSTSGTGGSSSTTSSSSLLLLPYVEKFGVYGYRAPEVHRERPYGAAVDVFAFGRVLLNMLRCIAPPPADNRWSVLKAHTVEALGLVARAETRARAYEIIHCNPLMSNVWPLSLRSLTARCLRADPAQRPTSAEIANELSLHEDLRLARA